jgi:hypothetical protein
MRVYVISHKRAANVPRMTELFSPQELIWCVGDGEAEAYRAAGAANVVESGGLVASRNFALDDAFAHGQPCLQTSDDLKRVSLVTPDGKGKVAAHPMEAAQRLLDALLSGPARMAGVAPTSNLFYFNPDRPAKARAFIVGDFIVVRETHLRFDARMRLKEDYDYTAAHLHEYGCVFRDDAVLAEYAHRSNPGGAVDYRTADLEQEVIRLLKRKWGDLIRDNPRRPNEILMNLKTQAGSSRDPKSRKPRSAP